MHPDLKKTLKSLSLDLRHLLEGQYDAAGTWRAGDLEQRLNALGVWRDRAPLPADELSHLNAADRQARAVVDAYLALRRAADIDQSDAVGEFVRETAYTWANRLLALRCMEARGLIDEVILQKAVYGGRSLEHHRLAQRQPELCMGDDDGLFAALDAAFARQAAHLPLLFDPRAPGVALRPSVAALKQAVTLLSAAPSDIFQAPDALGWAYQYWNTEEKDRVFEKVRTERGAKIAGADIIPATQLYTEPYMVKFLVQNSLGALWMGMYPESRLYESWEYYVRDADRAQVTRKPLREVTFLDPAVGSGHFLLEAFDLFYAMYEEEGDLITSEAICAAILEHNLYGIDIDERAVQIAEAALWMKAAEKAFDFRGTPANLVATNIRLPRGKDHLAAFLAQHPEDRDLRPALEVIFEGLEHADELGSLLQLEEPVEKELRTLQAKMAERAGKPEQAVLFAEMEKPKQGELPLGVESYAEWKTRTLARLKAHFAAEAQAADLRQAFFGRSAEKGVRLFDLLARRYDVVAANPPYMGAKNMSSVTRDYLAQTFSLSKADLYSCFIDVAHRLSSVYIAVITLHGWMFLKSFVQFRQHILSTYAIDLLVQLGRYAFSEADPPGNTCMLVAESAPPRPDHVLKSFKIRQPAEPTVQAEHLKAGKNHYFTSARQLDFLEIDESPISLGVPEQLLKIVSEYPKLSGEADSAAQVVMGSSTKNDTRFLRWFWEVPVLSARWKRFTKGGRYQKWYGLQTHCVDWGSEGVRPKNSVIEKYPYLNGNYGWVIKYEDLHFLPGITYTNMARGSLGCRLMDDSIPGHSSHAIYVTRGVRTAWLSLLNTHVVSTLLRIITQSLTFETGYIARTPVVEPKGLESLGQICVDEKKSLTCLDPLEMNFSVNALKSINIEQSSLCSLARNYIQYTLIHSLTILLAEGEIERRVIELYGLDKVSEEFVISETGPIATMLPVLVGYSDLPDEVLCRIRDAIVIVSFPNCVPDGLGLSVERLERALILLLARDSGDVTVAKTEKINVVSDDDEDVGVTTGRPLPAESLLERLALLLNVNPVSVYWLLQNKLRQGLRLSEEQQIVSDFVTVLTLRLLGHRWPKQLEAGEPVPAWAVPDGIIPLTDSAGVPTLLARVRERLAAEFPGGEVAALEREFQELMGESLETWLGQTFFKHHTRQFKKRPIAWQLQSGRWTTRQQPAFACLVYYHKLDGNTLTTLQSQYVRPLRQRYETELRGIEGVPAAARSARQDARRVALGDLIRELQDFDTALGRVAAEGFASPALEKLIAREPVDRWCSVDGVKAPPEDRAALLRQEQRYRPDLNDGVRVNIAPLQKAGLLAADVLAKKDLELALADRAEWRADERRWVREGKLPRPGWWEK